MDWAQILTTNLEEMASGFIQFLPSLVGALIILIVGWLLARILRSIIRRILRISAVDGLVTRVDTALEDSGFRLNVSVGNLIAQAFYWVVLLVVITTASETLQLDVLSNAINSFIAQIPNAIAALAIVIITLIISRTVRGILNAALEPLNLAFTGILTSTVGGIIIFFGVLTAVEQLGINVDLITNNFTFVVIGFIATFCVTFAIGSRTAIANLIAGYYVQRTLSPGDEVMLNGIQGQVVEVNATTVVLETKHGRMLVPNETVLSKGSRNK